MNILSKDKVSFEVAQYVNYFRSYCAGIYSCARFDKL